MTLNTTVMKDDAAKIRRLLDGQVICGFAGGTADAFAVGKEHGCPPATGTLEKPRHAHRHLRLVENLADQDQIGLCLMGEQIARLRHQLDAIEPGVMLRHQRG